MKQTRCIQISAHSPSKQCLKNRRITHINYYRTTNIINQLFMYFLFVDSFFALYSQLIWLVDWKTFSVLWPHATLTRLNIPVVSNSHPGWSNQNQEQPGDPIFVAGPVVRGQWSRQVWDNVPKFNTNTDVMTCAEIKFQLKLRISWTVPFC